MAGAYATLASGGVRHRPTGIEKVVFPDGKSEDLASGEGKRVLTDGQAAEVTRVLEMNVQSGTGTAANYGCPAAGKTGTTDEAKDAWFVGYTPHLSTAVWVGYPDAGIAMPGAQGGTYAAPGLARVHAARARRGLRRLPGARAPRRVPSVLRQVLAHRQQQLLEPYDGCGDGTTTDGTDGTGTGGQLRPALLRGGAAEPARRPGAAGAARRPGRHHQRRHGSPAASSGRAGAWPSST